MWAKVALEVVKRIVVIEASKLGKQVGYFKLTKLYSKGKKIVGLDWKKLKMKFIPKTHWDTFKKTFKKNIDNIKNDKRQFALDWVKNDIVQKALLYSKRKDAYFAAESDYEPTIANDIFMEMTSDQLGAFGKLWRLIVKSKKKLQLETFKAEQAIYAIDMEKQIKEGKENWKIIKKQQKDELAKVLQGIKEVKREIEYQIRQVKKHLIEMEKIKINTNQVNKLIKNFGDFRKKLTNKERSLFDEIMKDDSSGLQVVFESSWIEYAAWISPTMFLDAPKYEMKNLPTFYEQSRKITIENTLEDRIKKTTNTRTRGLLAIKIKPQFKSKRNKLNWYIWWNVTLGAFKRIIADPTGTNFWKVWYHKNRKNKKVLLDSSIYYNRKRKKRKKKVGRPRKKYKKKYYKKKRRRRFRETKQSKERQKEIWDNFNRKNNIIL